ncbi:MAG: hypothetical protein RL094_625 [Candidatus Parcubacteria bacterium]|jgi:HSP20 family protein
MKKRSFFERLTGSVNIDDEEIQEMAESQSRSVTAQAAGYNQGHSTWMEEPSGEGQLAVDVHQTPDDIVVRTMIPGVKKEDIDIAVSRDSITIKGKRMNEREAKEEDYFYRELYWGAFSRTIQLPHEVDIEGAEATENQGLLTIKLPRIDKDRQTKLRVRSL